MTPKTENQKLAVGQIPTHANGNPKKVGLCADCGHSWTSRGKTKDKPHHCPKCNSQNCSWVEDAIPATPPTSREKPIEAKAVALIMGNQNPETPAPNVDAIQAVLEAKETLDECQANNVDKIEALPVSEVLREILDDNVQVIENPIEGLDDLDAGEPPYAVWKNKEGKLSYAVLVNPEALEEVRDILIENEEGKLTEPTLSDIEILKEAGILNPDKLEVKELDTDLEIGDEDDEADENAQISKEIEKKHGIKTEKARGESTEEEEKTSRRGIPVVPLIGVLVVFGGVMYLCFKISERKPKTTNQIVRYPNERLIPDVEQETEAIRQREVTRERFGGLNGNIAGYGSVGGFRV